MAGSMLHYFIIFQIVKQVISLAFNYIYNNAPKPKHVDHPKWDKKIDLANQSRIFPGTEDNERIRIASALKEPSTGKDKLENWLLKELPCAPECKTVYSLWQRSRKLFKNNNFLGYRQGQ